METVKYSYLGWYKFSIFLFGVILIYPPGAAAYQLYNDGDISLEFWIHIVLTIAVFIPWLIYLVYLFSYRLTVGPHVLEQSSIMRTTIVSKRSWQLKAYTDSNSISSYLKPNISISKFNGGYAAMRRETDIMFESILEKTGSEPMSANVPSLSTYRRYQLTTSFVRLYEIPILFYTAFQMMVKINPIVHIAIFLAVLAGLSYLWYSNRTLPERYFNNAAESIQSLVVRSISFWTAAHAVSIAYGYYVESNFKFVLASVLASVLIYQLCRIFRHRFERFRTQYTDLFYTFFMSLPFVVYCVFSSVNRFPSPSTPETIYATVQQKQFVDMIIPSFTLTTNIWPDQQNKRISVIPPFYDQVQEGDTVSIQLYRGVLGVPWVRRKYYGRHTQEIQHISARGESTP